MRTLYLILTAVIAYVLGSINGAIIAGRFIFHKDVRRYGSGNAGLTNYYRAFGTPGMVLLVLIDVLKTVAAVLIGGALLSKADAREVGMLFAGFCTSLGHMSRPTTSSGAARASSAASRWPFSWTGASASAAC